MFELEQSVYEHVCISRSLRVNNVTVSDKANV